jgi:hypothetical protein
MLETIVVVIVWAIIRSVASKSARESVQRQKAEREEQAGGYAPKPARPSRPRGLGGWAEMLGKMTDGEDVFKKPAAMPAPWRNESAFPPAPPPMEPARQEAARSAAAPSISAASSFLTEGSFSLEGVDECHESMLTGPAPEPSVLDAAPVRFDAPALVKGVVFAEILTRPAQRRRLGTRM